MFLVCDWVGNFLAIFNLLLRLVHIIQMKSIANHDSKSGTIDITHEQIVGPRLFIHGLRNTDIEQIHELFSRYGQVTDIFFPKDSKSYVFLEYQRTSQAMLAIEELHDTVQFGGKMHVRFRKRRSQEMKQGCYCQCHAAKETETAKTPVMRKKKIRAIFGEIDHFPIIKNRFSLDQEIGTCATANSLDETKDESIDHPAQMPPSLDQSIPSPTIQSLSLHEFTLNYDEDDYFQ